MIRNIGVWLANDITRRRIKLEIDDRDEEAAFSQPVTLTANEGKKIRSLSNLTVKNFLRSFDTQKEYQSIKIADKKELEHE